MVIGIILIFLATVALVTIIILDILLTIFKTWNLGGFRRIIAYSANTSLLLYEFPFILFIVGTPYLIEETQSPFLKDLFPTIWVQVGVWIPSMILLFFLNVLRFRRLGLKRRDEIALYNIAIEIVDNGQTPDKGVNEGLVYIREQMNRFQSISERGFLQYLILRNHATSSIAHKKLDDLNE